MFTITNIIDFARFLGSEVKRLFIQKFYQIFLNFRIYLSDEEISIFWLVTDQEIVTVLPSKPYGMPASFESNVSFGIGNGFICEFQSINGDCIGLKYKRKRGIKYMIPVAKKLSSGIQVCSIKASKLKAISSDLKYFTKDLNN